MRGFPKELARHMTANKRRSKKYIFLVQHIYPVEASRPARVENSNHIDSVFEQESTRKARSVSLTWMFKAESELKTAVTVARASYAQVADRAGILQTGATICDTVPGATTMVFGLKLAL